MSISIPASSYTLANARLHSSQTTGIEAPFDGDGFALANIDVADGRITGIAAAQPGPFDTAAIDLKGRIVLLCFVDCHTHIDKGHIWPRKPNPDGSFPGALNAADADRAARWSSEDVSRRMDFSLRSAYAHGTKALRTHLDSASPQDKISWPVFEEMRERWKGRIELQAASLIGIDGVREADWFGQLANRVAAARGVLGAVTYMVPDLDELLDRLFRAATAHGLDLDFHADETDNIGAISLKKIAEAALRHRFEGKILVGHCCSLARQPDADVLDTLDKVARAGIAVVSLPMCNLYLQDRRHDGTTPRWRGVTLMHEMKARGIPVSVASDNTRDPLMLMAISICSKSTAWRRASCISTIRSATGRGRCRRRLPKRCGSTGQACCALAVRPISSSSRGAAGPSFCHGPNPTASWCATDDRSMTPCPTMPNSTI